MGVYCEYRFSFVPPDIIAFADKRGIAMEIALVSRANVHDIFQFLEVIE